MRGGARAGLVSLALLFPGLEVASVRAADPGGAPASVSPVGDQLVNPDRLELLNPPPPPVMPGSDWDGRWRVLVQVPRGGTASAGPDTLLVCQVAQAGQGGQRPELILQFNGLALVAWLRNVSPVLPGGQGLLRRVEARLDRVDADSLAWVHRSESNDIQFLGPNGWPGALLTHRTLTLTLDYGERRRQRYRFELAKLSGILRGQRRGALCAGTAASR